MKSENAPLRSNALLGRVCPKCRKAPQHFREQWGGFAGEIPFNLVDGVLIAEIHDGPDPRPIGVVAVCECGHEWTLRGITQIIELGVEHIGEA